MNDKAQIEFPVKWTFRIIVDGSNPECCMELSQVFNRFFMNPELKDGKASAGGRYQTVMADVVMPDRNVFEKLPEELGRVAGVRMVL